MIIACPSCGTRYAVPDTAIGATGRTVRCAKCGHSWHQQGPVLELEKDTVLPTASREEPVSKPTAPAESAPYQEPDAEDTVAAQDAEDSDKTIAAPATSPPLHNAPPGQDVSAATETHSDAPAYGDDSPYMDDFPAKDPFAHEPPFKPRRNPAKLWTRAAIGFALIAALLIGWLYVYGLPAGFSFGQSVPEAAVVGLEINLPIDEDDRRTLPDGTELFAASGSVINKSAERRDVPDMLIVLRNADDRIVYEQEIRAPVASLGPGEEARFDEALLDIPRSAVKAEISWAPGAL
ncbi:zinc-ribbon domain-containing protein [Alterisphingorhabdus coralli]|uniref:Zinc-ribbon domain-containing protein n=1 Tax=Alterisphingorhabdus coralli TaxID=3071408 RepID=A0AA97F7N5_9SPHN|nr:zinc-ribbon domain-containing protein [Parasphingorhabdus sp. SCSIO 66989]WOE75436.1 zinc-ribbon domain-containing protein [Parasphingorhabdus sp. SCSIO 66989]